MIARCTISKWRRTECSVGRTSCPLSCGNSVQREKIARCSQTTTSTSLFTPPTPDLQGVSQSSASWPGTAVSIQESGLRPPRTLAISLGDVQNGHAISSQYYDVVGPNGRVHSPPEGRCWVYSERRMQEEIAAGNIWFGESGNGVPRIKKFLNGHRAGLTPETLWTSDQVGTTDEAKKQLLQLFPEEPIFDTPKPERLLSRILEIATKEGDLVLDAYLGSGTTAAVAHKMNRRYVGIERGEQAISYCAARIRMVIDGDSSGVSGDVGWTGGGGVDFYTNRRRHPDTGRRDVGN